MIQVQDICLSYGETVLFNHISCVFQKNYRVGVVGRNGAGKSTFLKALAGQLPLDEGTVTKNQYARVAYMPQEIVLTSSKTAFEEAYDSLFVEENAECGEGDSARARARTEKVLKGLGFTPAVWDSSVTELSVGWKMRVILAKLLLQEADFYLFDEPTNHLDMVSKEWFYEFLKKARFGFLLVTHDRYYLERACEYIFELERGRGRLFTGNFSHYLTQKEQESEIQQAAHDRQQKEISRKQATINRFRASASKAKMAQSMMKQLDRMEIIEIDPVPPTINFTFKPLTRPGSIVLNFNNLKQVFDQRVVFQAVCGEIQRGEKIALVGPNGTGKTTLFNLLTGRYPRLQGSIEFGHNVSYAVFEQDQLLALKNEQSVYDAVLEAAPNVHESTIRAFLGAFLFSGQTVHKKIGMLSGGERCRVALVKLLLQGANFLLLDEPTNHLDMYAKEVLLQALQQYEGSILIVSHDHDFMQRLVGRVVELTPQALVSYPGTYESYLDQKKQLSLSTEASSQEHSASSPKMAEEKSAPKTQDKNALLKEQISLEQNIQKLEKKMMALNEPLGTYTYGTEEYSKALLEFQALEKELKKAQNRWQEITVITSQS